MNQHRDGINLAPTEASRGRVAVIPRSLFAAVVMAAAPLRAEIPPFFALGPRPAADVFAIGALYFHAPRYAGSEASRTFASPSGTVILRNGFFADPISGVGFNASGDASFEVGARTTLGLGRDESGAAKGLGKIHDALNVGTFANWNATDRLQFQSALRYGSGYDHRGALLDAGVSCDIFKRGPASVTVDGSVSLADRAYMRSFYGVTAIQAQASGYPIYSPRAGLQWKTVGLSVTAPVHPRALAYVSIDRTFVSGSAAGSPYVLRRNANSISANVSYGF